MIHYSHPDRHRFGITVSDVDAVHAICDAADPPVDIDSICFMWDDTAGRWEAKNTADALALVAYSDPGNGWRA